MWRKKGVSGPRQSNFQFSISNFQFSIDAPTHAQSSERPGQSLKIEK
jgi:hypothetical protein